jgi:Tol biopolymer transport system component
VSLDGGTPEEIVHVNARNPDISSDGKWLAFVSTQSGDDGVRDVIRVCELDNCLASLSLLTAPGLPAGRATPIRWTPNNTGVAYVNTTGAENIWVQPLKGDAKALTQFADGSAIKGFAWSPDRRLAVLRERTRSYVVLYKGIKSAVSRN